ncbi:hypothetical protein AX15_006478, partial [Amanita polypyramis BW_CC]
MGVLANRLQHDARAFKLLHPNQYGGIQGQSAIDAALLFTERAYQAKLHGMFTSVLVVDIAQFFPSIQAHIAVEIYRRQGFPEHLVQFLSSYLKECTTTYSLGAGTSDLFNMNSGIPQGCKICPIAACLYITPVLKTLLPWDPQSQCLLLSFIDDTALSTSSRSLEVNIQYLRSQYPCWKHHFQIVGLKLEDDKTKLFHVLAYDTHLPKKPLHTGHLPSLNIGSDSHPQIVMPQKSWRYLGFRFDPELSFKSHVDSWTTKASTSLRACKMLGNSQQGLTPKDKCLIYLTICLPILTYGFQLWYRPKGKGCKALLHQMDKVHLAAACWITGGFPDSPRNALLSIASLEPLQINLDRLSHRTALRLMMIHPASSIAKGHNPISSLQAKSVGRLHILGGCIHTEPPFSQGCNSTKMGPITALRDLLLPSLEGQHFDDDSPPGSRVIDLHHSQIQTLDIPPKPKDADETVFENWKSQVAHILDPILQETCLIIVASLPINIKRQKGVHRSILLNSNQCPIVSTKHWPLSNHHELTMAGLMDSLPSLLQYSGDVTILLHNKSATQSLFNEKATINGHYMVMFNKLIKPWLQTPTNRLFIGWIPANYTSPAIKPYILKLGAKHIASTPPIYYSAAT